MAASAFSSTNTISHSCITDFRRKLKSSDFFSANSSISCSRIFQLSSSRRRTSFSVNYVVSDQRHDTAATEDSTEMTLDKFQTDSASVVSSIKFHAEFTPSFSPEQFELPKAFHATAESVRDMLIIHWNATYDYYEKLNMKQAYYLSMEFLQGRALVNAIGNLGLTGPYSEALRKLGYNLEDVARQEPDAAFGNGGLGRLASCFLDSMATLNSLHGDMA